MRNQRTITKPFFSDLVYASLLGRCLLITMLCICAMPRVAHAAPGDTIEQFNNSWAVSTIGLGYDPVRHIVRYTHESQSSSHRATIYDVEVTASHAVIGSVTLSAKNSGWRWQLDNRDGATYDSDTGTYFLPDYNGDLSYLDDNIVEIDVQAI